MASGNLMQPFIRTALSIKGPSLIGKVAGRMLWIITVVMFRNGRSSYSFSVGTRAEGNGLLGQLRAGCARENACTGDHRYRSQAGRDISAP